MKTSYSRNTVPAPPERPAVGRFAALLAALAFAAGTSVSLNAQSPPEINIEKSVLLSWPETTTDEQIVLGAASVDGSWVPWLEPIFKRQGELCMAVPTTTTQQFFKLTPGRQFSDDFSDANKPWTACFPDAKTFELSYLDGALRIVTPTPGTWARAVLVPFPISEPKPFLHADFAMSVDILDWDENAAEMEFGLVARATPPPNCAQVLQSYTYMGELDFRRGRPAEVWIYGYPPNGPISPKKTVELNSEKAYRLVFSWVGSHLILRLLDLENVGVPLIEVEATNSTLSQGVPALWVFAVNSAYDLTVDNFMVSGTKP